MEELYRMVADPSRVKLSGIEEKYVSDHLGRLRGTCDALVFPIRSEEVSAVLKWAYDRSIPVTPRGAGTNLVGSTVPERGGIVLDLSRMNRILELDEQTLTVTVEPGVVLADLQAYVEERGLFYPPDPGEKQATIGGNISTNAGGMRAVKYGVTRDYVRGLTAVLPNGEVIRTGGKVVKDSSGLSLKHLLIGSEGTLGVITECVLKLIPKPTFVLGALVPFADLKTGIDAVIRLIHEKASPTAIEFMERKVVALGEQYMGTFFPFPDAAAYILLSFDGNSDSEVRAHADNARQSVLQSGALDFLPLDDPAVLDQVWKVRGSLVKAVEAVSEQEPVDIVVPIDKTAEFIAYANEVERETGVQLISFGHAGDGNVHLCVVRGERDTEAWQRDLKEVMSRIYGKSQELGGLTSGEHGIGLTKKPYFAKATDPVVLAAMRSVKASLDDRNILNAGKIF
ncbi:FAD-binding oxidoreductase [Gorillibacterium timonense]|uniref:FAD-binding oxidoreductase n=1 Tax=Gorillibacterium timonense TaxID=1689269 RepID=UPI00071E3069|nr:FAD-binding oxidoreductase [Gorillibacterium timonense]